MKPERTRSKLFTRRAALLTGGKLTLLGGLAARMYYLQVVEADRFKTLAEENRINFRLIAPERGYVTDRNGDYLAINVQNYQVTVVREQAKDVEAVLTRLAHIIDLDDSVVERVLRETRRRRSFVPIMVQDNLSWGEVSRIGVNAPDLPGVNIEVGQSRHYPYGSAMAHVVGYVSRVGKEDLTDDPLLELPGFRIGKNGIERKYDLALRGEKGTSKVEVNALGRIIQEVNRIEGQSGHEVRLTLDMRLQQAIADRIKDERAASVVVMDVHTGEVLAITSIPSYDPNAFSEGLSHEEWQGLVNNPYSPLSNKAIAGQYAPGSTFKIAVAAAAMENGISPDHTVYCPGHMELGDRKFHCWKRRGHGEMDLIGAMRESCDVWFYDVARRVGVDKIAEAARDLGLGEVTGIDLLGEKSGLIPTKKWKVEQRGQPWHLGESLVVGIGQGYVLTTPLQLAVMTARIANGGRKVTPYLTTEAIEGRVLKDRTQEISALPNLSFKPETLRVLREALDVAVNEETGTAYPARIEREGWQMGGKTGTAQVRRITKAEREAGVRKSEDVEWRLRDHALFVGYAPLENPRFAVSVVVEHGGGGSSKAAPIAKDVLLAAQDIFGVPYVEPPRIRPPNQNASQSNSEAATRAVPPSIEEAG